MSSWPRRGTRRRLAATPCARGGVPSTRPWRPRSRWGFPVSATLARSLNAQLFDPDARDNARDDLGRSPERLAGFPESVAAFRKADGTRWTAGDLLIQPDLAATLDRIAASGPDEF